MESVLWLIPFLPFAGFLLNGLLGKKLSESLSGLIASATIGASFVLGLLSFNAYLENHEPLHQVMFTWLPLGSFDVSVAYTLDALSLVMVLVVTGVGFLIHVYSIGYMKGDSGIQRYFAYLNLFTFMMLNLVMADNLLLLFLGWEGVGLCSYLLIGFWFEDPTKAAAGKKAFVVNRIGDFGFLLGMILILSNLGSLNFGDILHPEQLSSLEAGLVTTIALVLFLGGSREVRPNSALRMAAGCHGRSNAGECSHPCGDNGDGGSLSRGPHGCSICTFGDCSLSGSCGWSDDCLFRRHHGNP